MTARSAILGGSAIRTTRLSQAIPLFGRFPPPLLQLIFRVAIAAVFWNSGLTKIAAVVMSATFEL